MRVKGRSPLRQNILGWLSGFSFGLASLRMHGVSTPNRSLLGLITGRCGIKATEMAKITHKNK